MCDPLFQRVKETLQGLLNDSKFVFFIYKGFSDIYAEKICTVYLFIKLKL